VTSPERISPPPESLIASTYPNATLLDAYAIPIPENNQLPIEILAQITLGHPSLWFKTLIRIRDTIATLARLKTTHNIRQHAQSTLNGAIDFFPILNRTDNELIFGEDDTHLTFRLSLLRQPDRLIATTVVHCKNRTGRIYLTVIRPFHHLVVFTKLKNASRIISS